MSARVRIAQDGDGRLVAIKAAHHPDEVVGLQGEAGVLAMVDHPGVVRLHHLDTQAGELVTAWIGARSLADLIPLPPRRAARLVTQVADTVADLHERGLAHLRLAPSHVLLDHHDRPVLTGLAHAGPVGAPDPTGAIRRPATDVGALGTLLSDLLDDAAVVDRPRPPQRVLPRWGGRGAEARDRRLLADLVTHLTGEDPLVRPPARAVAARLRAIVSSTEPLKPAEPPEALEPLEPAEPAPHSLGVLAQLDALVDARRIDPRRPRRAGVAWATASATTLAIALGVSTLAARAWAGGAGDRAPAPPAPAAPPPAATPEAPVTGPAPTVVVGTERYAVGMPGDDVAVGDWRCDGRPRALVVRPGTGAVFLFDGWAPPDLALRSSPIASVPPGARLTDEPAATDQPACPLPHVRLADGRVAAIALPAATP